MPQARILLIYIKDWDDRRESSDGLSASSFEVRNGSTTSTSTFWGGETNLYDDAARRTETWPRPKCARAPKDWFITRPGWSRIFWNFAAGCGPCPAPR